jgi:deoxyribodipyrimidine photo-lyase
VFNPSLQAERFDPQWEYIKKWVPEVGTSSYAKPIVDHAFARERVLRVYKQGLSGA